MEGRQPEANKLVVDAANKWNGGHRQKADNSQIDFKAHHQAALRFATSSAVLLKNDGALPLAEKSKITVIGGMSATMKFQGGGSSHISTANYPSALESLKALGFEIDYAEGYPTDIGNVSEKGYEEALELAKKAAAEKRPLLFFCGLTEEFEGEGFDRETIALPQVQTKLLDKILETGYNDPQFLEGRQPKMLMYGKVSQENYVELTAASAIPNKEIKSPQILRY